MRVLLCMWPIGGISSHDVASLEYDGEKFTTVNPHSRNVPKQLSREAALSVYEVAEKIGWIKAPFPEESP